MVVFQCDGCGESIRKPKAEQHVNTCRFCRALVCMDCMKRFTDDSYKQHTSCISEAQKYQGALYKPPKTKGKPQQKQQQAAQQAKPQPQPQPQPQETKKEEQKAVKRPRPEEETSTKTEDAAKKPKKMHASKDLVTLLAQKMTESREEGESMEDLQARTEKMLRHALKKAVAKVESQ